MTPLATENDTATRLHTAVGRLSRRLRAMAAAEGLTPTDSSVLFSIARNGPLGMTELARTEDLNPTMLSRVVARLEERGLVQRAQDPEDRRATLVAATPQGADLRARIRAARGKALGSELDHLSPAHQEALEAALPALEALVEAMQR